MNLHLRQFRIQFFLGREGPGFRAKLMYTVLVKGLW